MNRIIITDAKAEVLVLNAEVDRVTLQANTLSVSLNDKKLSEEARALRKNGLYQVTVTAEPDPPFLCEQFATFLDYAFVAGLSVDGTGLVCLENSIMFSLND